MKKILVKTVLGAVATGVIATSGVLTTVMADDINRSEVNTAAYYSPVKSSEIKGELYKENTKEVYASKEVLDGVELENTGENYVYKIKFKAINIGSLYKIKAFSSYEDALNNKDGHILDLKGIGTEKQEVIIESKTELKEIYFKLYFDSIKELFPNNYEENEELAAEIVRLDISKIEEKSQYNETNVNVGESVNLKITDGGPVNPDIRRGVDSIGRIIEKNGKKFIRLKYYSKNESVVGIGNEIKVYDSGLRNLSYADDKLKNEKEAKILEKRVVETGNIQRGDYEISEVDVPIDGKDKVYLYAKVLGVNGIEYYKFGILYWESGANILQPEETKVDTPNFLNVKQLGTNIKGPEDERLEFDFEKDGKIHSPYMSKDGKKFKLSTGNHALSVFFKRDNLDNTKLRYIRYTLDGKEPTADSPAASIGFRNNAGNILANKFYEITIDPLADVPNFTKKGGNVVLKVKGYSADNSETSETKEFTFPFDSYSLDEVDTQVHIGDKTYNAKLDTNRLSALTEDVRLSTGKVEENEIRESLEKAAKDAGIKDAQILKLRVLDSKGDIYKPYYRNEWNEDKNPLMRLAITDYPVDENTSVFIYKNGEFRPVAAYRGYTGLFYVDVNQPEAFYVFGSTENLKEKQVEKLKETIKNAEDKIKDLNTSKEKVKVQQEIEQAGKMLSKASRITLDKTIRFIDNIERYMKAMDGATQDKEYLSAKAKVLVEIADKPILKDLLKDSKYNLIQSKKDRLIKDVSEENIKALEAELENLDYKYSNKEVAFSIRRYDNSEVESMANGVFDNRGRLIFKEDKTYLEINLKTLKVLTIRAHLLHLSVFKATLDEGEEFKVYSLGKFDDLARNGKLEMFDKKILLEIPGDLRNFYNIRVDNDGMPGANPQAKLYIEDISKVQEKTEEKEKLEFKIQPKKWDKNSGLDLKFKVNASKDDLVDVKVDGILLDKSKYRVESGSTVLTLGKDYLNTLKSGKHTLELEFKEGEKFLGGSVHAEFDVENEKIDNQIPDEKPEIDGKEPKSGDKSKSLDSKEIGKNLKDVKSIAQNDDYLNNIKSPKTGDSKNILQISIVAGIVSVGGLISTILFRKKKAK